MHEHNKFKYIAFGLGVGTGVALLFLVWAVPEFRNPAYYEGQKSTQHQQPARPAEQESTDKKEWRHWIERLVSTEDTLAQWVMALFSIVATGFTVMAVIWARRAVRTNEAQIRAYFRLANISFDWEQVPFGAGFKVVVSWENCGQSPATKCLFLVDSALVQIDTPENSIPSFSHVDMIGAMFRTAPIGQIQHSEICTISGDDAARLYKHELKLILYSAVSYTDVFGGVFIEEVCNVAVFPASNQQDKIRFRAYPHHNEYKQVS